MHLSHVLIDMVSKPVVLLLLDPVPDKGKGVLLRDPKALSCVLMDMFLEDSLLRSACDLYVVIVSLGDVLDLSAWSEVYRVLVLSDDGRARSADASQT